VAAEVHTTSPSVPVPPDVPPEAPAPSPPKKAGDDGVIPMVLAGLGMALE
jgi:hypothetical protein